MDCPFCDSEALTSQFALSLTNTVRPVKVASDIDVQPVVERSPKPSTRCITGVN